MWLLMSGGGHTKRVCILKAHSLAKAFPVDEQSQSWPLSFSVFDVFIIVRVSKSRNAEAQSVDRLT